jgi:hypothetical protein
MLVAAWLEKHLGITVPELVVSQEPGLFDDL